MPKRKWTEEQKKAFAIKMKAAKAAKKTEVKPEPPKEPKILAPEVNDILREKPVIHPLADIVNSYFPKTKVGIENKGNEYVVTFELPDGHRCFVVSKGSSQIETENWCKRIKAKVEGKAITQVTGVETMAGIRDSAKKIPPEIGSDAEFFFRD